MRKVAWFIQPLDNFTNSVIAGMKAGRAEDFIEKKDGIENLWRCPMYSFISALARSKNINLRFRVYRQMGSGKLQKWPFDRKKGSAISRSVAHRLETMKKMKKKRKNTPA